MLTKDEGSPAKRIACSTLTVFVALYLMTASAEELNAARGDPDVFVVTNTADSGPGSLREAIMQANASGQPGTIEFDIPGAGPHVIQPDTLLPALTVPMLVDGLSQDGADCAMWPPTLKIEISGANLTHFDAYGLALNPGSGGSEIRGLVVRDVSFNNNSDGLHVASDANHIACNFIGTDVTGTIAAGNTTGIELRDANLNVIGTEPNWSGLHERNLISGNDNIGIRIGRGDNNRISGNWIGTDVAGTGALSGGTGLGISTFSGSSGPVESTVIGYDGAGDPELMRNVISGNRIGVSLGGHTRRTHVAGNYIGLNAQGTAAVANSDMGISSAGGHPDFQRLYNIIGWDGTPGQRVTQRNVISGNGQGGVYINYFNNMGNEGAVVGNWIGTDAQGDTAVPNGIYGLNLAGGVDPTRELVHGNRIENNPVGIRLEGNSSSTQHPSFWNVVDTPELPNLSSRDNCIAGNGAGVARAGSGISVAVTFINNWWGAGDGPGGSGGGSGDSIPGELNYQPFLTEPPANCVGPVPDLYFDPLELDFGNVEIDTTSTSLTASLHNGGDADATVLEFFVPASFNADADDCGNSLPAGESCQLAVTFTPDETGVIDGTLTVDSAEGAVAEIEMVGNGVEPGVLGTDPDHLHFEEVVITRTRTLPFNIVNTGGTGVELASVALESGGPSFAIVSIGCAVGTVLDPGESCVVEISFTPQQVALHEGAVRVISDDSDEGQQVTVDLSGTVLPDEILADRFEAETLQ